MRLDERIETLKEYWDKGTSLANQAGDYIGTTIKRAWNPFDRFLEKYLIHTMIGIVAFGIVGVLALDKDNLNYIPIPNEPPVAQGEFEVTYAYENRGINWDVPTHLRMKPVRGGQVYGEEIHIGRDTLNDATFETLMEKLYDDDSLVGSRFDVNIYGNNIMCFNLISEERQEEPVCINATRETTDAMRKYAEDTRPNY